MPEETPAGLPPAEPSVADPPAVLSYAMKRRLANLRKPWAPGESGNSGGAQRGIRTPEFRTRCREVAARIVQTFRDMSYEKLSELPVADRLEALRVMGDRGGYLSADREFSLLLKTLASPALNLEQRQSVIQAFRLASGIEPRAET